MDTNNSPIPFFEAGKKEMKIVNIAFWGIIVLSLYFQVIRPFLSAHGGNALVMLFAPVMRNPVSTELMSIAYLALTAVLYNAVRMQLRRRNSWAQWVCAAAIGALVAGCIVNALIAIMLGGEPNLYNRMSLSIISTAMGLRLFANFAILVLSVFLVFKGGGRLRIAGIIYIVSFVAGILLGEFGLFFNELSLQVMAYISTLLNLLFLIFLRLSFRPVGNGPDDEAAV